MTKVDGMNVFSSTVWWVQLSLASFKLFSAINLVLQIHHRSVPFDVICLFFVGFDVCSFPRKKLAPLQIQSIIFLYEFPNGILFEITAFC